VWVSYLYVSYIYSQPKKLTIEHTEVVVKGNAWNHVSQRLGVTPNAKHNQIEAMTSQLLRHRMHRGIARRAQAVIRMVCLIYGRSDCLSTHIGSPGILRPQP
jgi:hypothetical protein